MLIEVIVHVFQLLAGNNDIIDNKPIGDIMLKTQPKYPNYEFEEMVVVLVTDARVEIATVMVEAASTPIALATVLGPGQYV